MILSNCKECGCELGPKPKFASNHELCSDECKSIVRRRNFGGKTSTAAQWKSKGIIKKNGTHVSVSDYEEILKSQNGHCALCSDSENLCLDHDHITLQVRGILCQKHNTGLGKLGDTIPDIQSTLRYLQNFQQVKSNKWAGIDYSMSCPAICTYEGDPKDFSYELCQFHYYNKHKSEIPNIFGIEPKEYSCDMERFHNIAKWATTIVLDCATIGLEGYSMGSKGLVFQIGENTGILKHMLWKSGKEVACVAPTVVKKFATGKGNATKDKMVEQFKTEVGIDLKEMLQPKRLLGSPTTDLVDAFYICKYFVTGNTGTPNR